MSTEEEESSLNQEEQKAGELDAGPLGGLMQAITADVDERLENAGEEQTAAIKALAERFGTSDTEMGERFADLTEKMEETRKEVSTLHDLVTELPAGGPWLWEALGPQAQRELWTELDAFVSWLQNRILRHNSSRLNWLPSCWYKHPDAVEQLTALMVAHKASYNPKMTTASHSLVDWFHRCLWPTMEVIKSRGTFKYCIEQREHKEVVPAGEMLAGSADFAAFVDATVPETESDESDGEVLPWSVDRGTGEVIESSADDEPPEPDDGSQHG